MVEHQLRARGIDDERVLAAMARVPRELFVSPELRAHAYADDALPIGHDQTISQPYMVARICAELALHGDEKVLDVGTGSGYQAAVLAELAGEVHSIERIPELAERARGRARRGGLRGPRARPRRRRDEGPARGCAVCRNRRRRGRARSCRRALYEQLEPRRPARRPDRRPPAADARGDRPHAGGPRRPPHRPLPLRAAARSRRVCAASARLDTMGRMGSSAAASLQLPVRLRGIQLGRPTDLLARHGRLARARLRRALRRRVARASCRYAACQPGDGRDRGRVVAHAARGRRLLREARRLVPLAARRRGASAAVCCRTCRSARAASSRSSSRARRRRGSDPAAGAVVRPTEPPQRRYPRRAVDAPPPQPRPCRAALAPQLGAARRSSAPSARVGYVINLAVYAALLHARRCTICSPRRARSSSR